MVIAYSILLFLSLVLLIGYVLLVKEKEKWLIILFSSIIIANSGYLLEAISSNVYLGLFANDVTYLGAIIIMLSTYISIKKLCSLTIFKKELITLIILAILMFLVVCIFSIIPYYYTDVQLVKGDGYNYLVKEYGPLYNVYIAYIVIYLIGMMYTIIYSITKHRIKSFKVAVLLFFVAFANIITWRLQKSLDFHFNLLSVSYVIGACVLLLLFWMMQDYVHKSQIENNSIVVEKVVIVNDNNDSSSMLYENVIKVIDELPLEKKLTETEQKILILILENKLRKEIAFSLHVSENTVKTHISHIYSKLEVKSKYELQQKFNLRKI